MKNMPVITAQITMIARRLHRMLSRDSKIQGLRVTEHHTIMELYRLGGECGHEDLIVATCFHKSTISKAVSSLEKKGWLKSYGDPDDVYKKRVLLLEEGNAYAKPTSVTAAGLEEQIFADLSGDDRKKVYEYLERFYNNLRVGQEADKFPSDIWPLLGHYCMNSVKYMEYASPLFQNEGREANQKHILMCMVWFEKDGMASYKDIEKMLGISQSVVVRQIQKLETAGMVESFISESDKRVKFVRLTDKGRATVVGINKVFMQTEKNGLTGFGRKEKKEFAELLSKVIEKIDALE